MLRFLHTFIHMFICMQVFLVALNNKMHWEAEFSVMQYGRAIEPQENTII